MPAINAGRGDEDLQVSNRAQVTAAKDLAGGYIKALKARGAEVGVWELRGKVFARVMVVARDARLSGAEWNVLTTLALHLHHLGRSKGMMTVASLADDCMVTERTVKNALRVLAAAKFISIRFRQSGQIEVLLDRRFNPKAPVPADKSADKSPRRSVPRKNFSTIKNSTAVEFFITDECTDSAPKGRRESTGEGLRPRTANGNGAGTYPSWHYEALRTMARRLGQSSSAGPNHDPPRKRATPGPSG